VVGDENRTRIISLGSAAVTAASGADLPVQVSARDRDCPLVTLANGPLIARRSRSGLPNHVRPRAQCSRDRQMASRPGPQEAQRPRTGSGAAGTAISAEPVAGHRSDGIMLPCGPLALQEADCEGLRSAGRRYGAYRLR
jgi:hypothetical protein